MFPEYFLNSNNFSDPADSLNEKPIKLPKKRKASPTADVRAGDTQEPDPNRILFLLNFRLLSFLHLRFILILNNFVSSLTLLTRCKNQ